MPSSSVSIGKRPEFKQTKSAGWGWPRLVPVQEQLSRSSQAGQSSASPSLRDHRKQEELPPKMIATIISKLHAEEDAPLSPVPNAAGRPPAAEGPVAGAADHQPYEEMPGSLLSMADLKDEGRTVASRRDASSTSNSVEDLARNNSPGTKHPFVQDTAEKHSPTSNGGAVQDQAGTSLGTQRGFVQNATEKDSPASRRGSIQDIAHNLPDSQRAPVRDVTEDSQDSSRESLRNVVKKTSLSSSSGFGEGVAEMIAPASENGAIEHAVSQDDIEIPVAYESEVTDVPLKEEKPATPPTTPVPPVMDRISVPSTSVPYYATPKIMIHRPSQSSQEETQSPRTIDEVLAHERRSLPQANDSQPSQSTPDANLADEPPMQSMSLKPIAWQAPNDKKVRKRKLYLRKFRNAAARKTILKATLGRQLAIPTKQMLRLLANGENLTIPDLSTPGVEAATMLVPQEAVGSVTGAILLPQGVAGTVADG